MRIRHCFTFALVGITVSACTNKNGALQPMPSPTPDLATASEPPDMARGWGGHGGYGGGGGGGSGGSGGYHLDGGEPGPLAGGLTFAVFGDCRPPNQDDTNGYPSAIIGNIFTLAKTLGAQFVVGTGDYMFASMQSSVDAQVQLFQQAQSNYSGPVYLTMGNHECTGYTASNCPNGNESPNIQAFIGKLLPSGTTTPYYRIDKDTPMGKAKFLFVAANAWSTTQQTWLQQQLADPTTYTFIVRHEPAATTEAPGVTPSEQAMQGGSYTLALLGHSHEYKRVDTTHVISGNGGAPVSGGTYGLLLVQQQSNGNITVTEYDQASGAPIDLWSVTPTGQTAP